tara:strand:+ start:611 stop:1249 length:639 start_codon:yes stop_codon:yes gene_type:complete
LQTGEIFIMSKKTLLGEGTVRQFMKLADLKPFAGEFINENYMEEDAVEEGMHADDDMKEGMHEDEEELPPEAGAEEAPMDMDMDMGAEEGDVLAGVSEEAVEELISVVADALASATGVDIDVTGDAEGAEDMGDEMDFAPAEVADEEAPADEEDMMEMAHEDDEMMEELEVIDEDAIMQETFRRVSNRLSSMNKEKKLVEAVTAKVLAAISR